MKMFTKQQRIFAVVLSVCLAVCCTTVTAETVNPIEPTQISNSASAIALKAEDLPANIQALLPKDAASDSVYLRASEKVDGAYDAAELYTLRTENHTTGEGTLTVHSVPIKYIDGNGELQFIDTSIRPTASTRAGYSYQNAANRFTVEYGTAAATGVCFDDTFVFAAKTTVASTGKQTVLQTATDTVLYANAFGSNTAVEYINTENGVKENIILNKYTGQTRFDFVFRSETHVPILAADGAFIWIAHKDTPKEPEYRFLSLYAYDSYDPAVHGVQKGSQFRHMNEDLYYDLTSNDDGSYTITVVVPEEYLTHPEIVYPVTIDPSITLTSTDTNAHDTFVDASKPTTQNNYDLDYIRFGKKSGHKLFGYHRFVSLPALPTASYISNATLKFTFRAGQNTPTASSGIYMWTLMVIDHQWSESTVTWANQPYGDTGPLTAITYNGSYLDSFSANLTDEVCVWYESPSYNYGIDFTYSDEDHNDYNSVYSSESTAARAPVLNITYNLIQPNSVALSSTHEDLVVGQTLSLRATVNPSNAADTSVTWTTSNSSVATVNSNGKVTAKQEGTATISATTTNGKTAQCTIDVDAWRYAENTEEVVTYTTVSSGIPIIVAYRIYVNACVTINQQTSSSNRRVSSVTSYTELNKNAINPILERPSLGVGVTRVNNTQLNMGPYTGSLIFSPNVMLDYKEALPNLSVGSSATLSTLSVCFQSDALYPYQDVELTFDF